MARLIDDLLDVTRLTHGKVRLRPERVELCALAERVAESIRPLMQERGHEFRVLIPDCPIWIDGDPIRLDQVLVNLLNNAGGASPTPAAGLTCTLPARGPKP